MHSFLVPLPFVASLFVPIQDGPPEAAEGSSAADALSPDVLVVTPTRAPESWVEVPYTVQSIDAELMERRVYRTVPQALRDVPGVMVQETAHGHGSPYIRGFTSRRNLFLVDGIRLNNSVFREGPNQYWNTVDGLGLERLEVVKGPSSVLYGSDSIGGTVNALTKDPYITDRPIGGRWHTRLAQGESSNIHRLELGGAVDDDTTWLLGLSRKDLGDVEAGSPTGVQPQTGYDEWAGDLKVKHWIDDNTSLTVLHQQVDQDDVPRTHRTVFAVPFEGTSVGSDLRRDFDQNRSLTYARLDRSGDIDWSATLYRQRQEETRFRTRSNGNEEEQGFDARTLGLMATASGDWGDNHRWTVGFEWAHDDVDSFLEKFANQTPADDIQGPVGDDATYDLGGLFAQDVISLSDRTDLTVGGRFTYATAEADSVRDPVSDTQISVDDSWSAFTGSLRLDHAIAENDAGRTVLFGGASQGFRAPNLSDLTRFDAARTNEFEIPSTDLDEERFLQFELGVKHEDGDLTLQAAVFYTLIDDFIQRFPTGNVNGSGEVEVEKRNFGDGFASGAELGAAYRIDEAWTLFGDLAILDGEIETIPDGGGQPFDDNLTRLMPMTFRVGVRWDPSDWPLWIEGLVTSAAKADDLSQRDIADDSRVVPGGTPAWTTLDLRGGLHLDEDLELLFGVENFTDEDYRIHGSGQNRVGQNIYVGFTWTF